MSLEDNESKILKEISFTKKCILMSLISQNKKVILMNSFHNIPIVKLYTADFSYQNFVYSKVKGAFCIFMDKDPKVKKYYFRIYNLKDYSLSFEMEIKQENRQYITQYKEDFYYMELRQSFIGFKFMNKDSGRKIFILLNEEPKKEILEQNERAMNIKAKDINKELVKVLDYIKMKLKLK